MPASKMAHGCRCGASATLPKSSASGLRAPANADIVINLVRPTAGGRLADAADLSGSSRATRSTKSICGNTATTPASVPGTGRRCRSDRPYVSAPYLSFSIGAPVITVSAPLRGKVPGVIAADLKLDTFSDFVQAQRPGQHGTVMIFDQAGSLIAHPEFADFVASAMTHPSRSSIAQHRRDQFRNRGLRAATVRTTSTTTKESSVMTNGTGLSVQGDEVRARRSDTAAAYCCWRPRMTLSRTSASSSSTDSFSRSWSARPSFRSSGCSAAGCRVR